MFCSSPSAVFGLAVRPQAPSTSGTAGRLRLVLVVVAFLGAHVPSVGRVAWRYRPYGVAVDRARGRGDTRARSATPTACTSPTRGETKLDLVNYYLVGRRRASCGRCASGRACCTATRTGVDGEKIYQKRLPKGAPEWVETVEVRFPSGRTADELCVTELADVVWAVQMSTVEFHPWHSRRADTEQPDELRIDLDPQPGAGFAECQAGRRGGARGARRARRGRLAQDVRVEGHARLRAHRAAVRLPRGAPGGAGVRPRGRAADAAARDDRLVEGGARRGRCSSTTTRTPATARSPRRTRCAAGRGGRCRRR